MLIRDPVREELDILFHSVVLGVEDVDSVKRGSDPVLVNVVVAVTSNVISLIDDEALKDSGDFLLT